MCKTTSVVVDFLIIVAVMIGIMGQTSLKIQPFSFPTESVIGKRATATCTTTSGEKMTFKWLKNGKELSKGLNVDIRSFSDLSNIVMDPLKEEDTGNYTCLVKAKGLTESYTTTLEVLVPPSWIHFPKDIDALSGDPVTMNCKASGKPLPAVTWTRTSGEGMEFMPVSTSSEIMLYSNGTLHINSISKMEEGMYRCNISNGIGPPLLKTIVLKVIGGHGSIQIQPFSFPAKSVIGRRISVTCTPILGEKMDFKWLKNDKEITKGLNIDIRSFSDLSALVIDPLKEEDSGNYTCLVKSRGMSGSYTTTLEVLVPPSWNSVPNDVDALSGDSVILNCKGNGRPNPTVNWFRTTGNNLDFIPLTSLSSIFSNGSLHLNAVTKDDEGMYKCNISNGIGSSLFKTIVIRVIDD